MKHSIFLVLAAVLCVGVWGSSVLAAAAMKPVEFHFENFTNEDVVLSAMFKDNKGTRSRTIRLAPNASSTEAFEGCLEEVRLAGVSSELALKGIQTQTSFKPKSSYKCKTLMVTVHKDTNGALELRFVYQ